MKYLKKKKTSPWIWAVPVAVVVILALVLILFLSGRTEAPQESQPENENVQPTAEATSASEETAMIEVPEIVDVTIETPYAAMQFPGEWEDFLRVEIQEGDVYTVTFHADLESGKTQQLFAVGFGGSMETALGTVNVDGSKVPVQVYSSEFAPDDSWTDREINIVYTMQEALNQVLTSLSLEMLEQTYEPEETVLPPESSEEMRIDTPYGELVFPARWEPYLELETQKSNGYSVTFYGVLEGHAKQLLFTVCYGGDQGIPVTTVQDSNGKDVEVLLSVEELELGSDWSDEDKRIIQAMQEDMNYLLSNLMGE